MRHTFTPIDRLPRPLRLVAVLVATATLLLFAPAAMDEDQASSVPVVREFAPERAEAAAPLAYLVWVAAAYGIPTLVRIGQSSWFYKPWANAVAQSLNWSGRFRCPSPAYGWGDVRRCYRIR